MPRAGACASERSLFYLRPLKAPPMASERPKLPLFAIAYHAEVPMTVLLP